MFVSALSSARLQQKEKCRLQVIKTSVICIKAWSSRESSRIKTLLFGWGWETSKVSGQTVFVDVTMLPFSQDMEIGLRPDLLANECVWTKFIVWNLQTRTSSIKSGLVTPCQGIGLVRHLLAYHEYSLENNSHKLLDLSIHCNLLFSFGSWCSHPEEAESRSIIQGDKLLKCSNSSVDSLLAGFAVPNMYMQQWRCAASNGFPWRQLPDFCWSLLRQWRLPWSRRDSCWVYEARSGLDSRCQFLLVCPTAFRELTKHQGQKVRKRTQQRGLLLHWPTWRFFFQFKQRVWHLFHWPALVQDRLVKSRERLTRETLLAVLKTTMSTVSVERKRYISKGGSLNKYKTFYCL